MELETKLYQEHRLYLHLRDDSYSLAPIHVLSLENGWLIHQVTTALALVGEGRSWTLQRALEPQP